MNVEKKVIANLNKCYSIAELDYKGQHCFLVAAEKSDPCYLFSENGEKLDTVWEGPGGVMTMCQVPGSDGEFLATQLFYSPNDSLNAKIVIVSPDAKGDWDISLFGSSKSDEKGWNVRVLCETPFVHRFGILHRGGANYLIVCCLKSGHEYKNDWRFPGACYGALLPSDLSEFGDGTTLELTLLMDGMTRNHGYCLKKHGGHDAALVGCEEGAFLFEPPAVIGADWEITQISNVPCSDAVLMDFDGDGKDELGIIAPFHGNSLTIWHLDEFDNYVPQWKLPLPEKDTEMLHATWADTLLGKPTWIVGWRKGTKDTIAITWDEAAGDYKVDYIDKNTGCANACHFVNKEGKDVIVAANREIDEIAMYTIS